MSDYENRAGAGRGGRRDAGRPAHHHADDLRPRRVPVGRDRVRPWWPPTRAVSSSPVS